MKSRLTNYKVTFTRWQDTEMYDLTIRAADYKDAVLKFAEWTDGDPVTAESFSDPADLREEAAALEAMGEEDVDLS